MKMVKLMLASIVVALGVLFARGAIEEVDGIKWWYKTCDGGVEISSGSSAAAIDTATAGAITVPAQLGGKPVVAIGSCAFQNCSQLTSVVLPDTVKIVAYGAFENDYSLKELNLSQVTNIASWACYNCRMGRVDLSSVQFVGEYAFCSCYSLSNVVVGSEVAAVGNCAFQNTYFQNNASENSLLVLDGKVALGYKGSCPAAVSIPSGVRVIADGAFQSDRNLDTVSLPSSLVSIGSYAFDGTALMGVNFPHGLKTIGNCAFRGCGGLSYVRLPENVTAIGSYAFSGCDLLESIELPEPLESIGAYAFSECTSLESITIPQTVSYMGYDTFENCESLLEVIFEGDRPLSYSWPYSGTPEELTTYVPYGSIGWYNTYSAQLPETWCDRAIEHYGTPGTFELRLDVNGGDALTKSVLTGKDGESVYISYPQREGWNFQGWYTEAEDGDLVVWSGEFYPGGETTIYAHWTQQTVYAVTLDYNDGVSTNEILMGHSVELPTPTREGYAFQGWYDETSGDYIGYGGTWYPCASRTIYAQWMECPTYKATLIDSLNGTTNVIAGSGNEGNYVQLTDPKTDGYYFRHWRDAENGNCYSGGCGLTLASDRTFYAVWAAICTVTLNYMDGVTSSTVCTSGVNGASVYIKSPSRSGYDFMGWYDARTGGSQKAWSGYYNFESDCTLYAHWSRNGVDVTGEQLSLDTATGYTWFFVIGEEGTASITQVTPSPSGTLVIPDAVWDDASGTSVRVTGLSPYAFQGESGLTAVVFPATLTYIGSGAFAETGLKNVTIPATVTSFSLSAFDSCKQLETLAVAAKTVSSDCSLDLYDCPKLTTLNLPDSIGGIDPENDGWYSLCVEGLSSLASLTVPEGVTSLDCWSGGLTNLAAAYLPSTLNSLSCGTFVGCWKLDKVVFAGDLPAYNGESSVVDALDVVLCFANSIYYPSIYAAHWEKILRNSGYGGTYGVYVPTQTKTMAAMVAAAPQYATEEVPDIGPFVATVSAQQTIAGAQGLEMSNVPIGLTWNSASGTLSGTAKVAGAYTVQVGGEDLTLRVDPSPDGEEQSENIEIVLGAKVDMDLKLVGYSVKDLPKGLVYTSRTGKLTGTAKSVTATDGVVVTFSKKDVDDVELIFVVRKENAPTIDCESLDGTTLTLGVTGGSAGIPLDLDAESGVKSVTATKLPTGMKIASSKDKTSWYITGAPTKAGAYEVAITLTSAAGSKVTEKFTVTVAALPSGATGTFNGFVLVDAFVSNASDKDGSTSSDAIETIASTGNTLNAGTLQVTVSDVGKITAKVVAAAGTYSFTAMGWDSVNEGVYSVEMTTKKGDVLTLACDSTAAWNAKQMTGTFTPVDASTYAVEAQKNAFGKQWFFNATGDDANGWTLSFAENAKTAALTVTLNADGKTAVAGKLGTYKITASGYADVSGIGTGAIFADFAPVVTVGKTKKALSLRANLWFDKKNDHEQGVGSAVFVQ